MSSSVDTPSTVSDLAPYSIFGAFGAFGADVAGTFSQFVRSFVHHVTPIPDELDSAGAASLLCAGVTTYKALKVSNTIVGNWVAIPGAGGGLGHLCVQYAVAMGLKVIAIDTGKEKEELCKSLGASVFLDFKEEKGGFDLVDESLVARSPLTRRPRQGHPRRLGRSRSPRSRRSIRLGRRVQTGSRLPSSGRYPRVRRHARLGHWHQCILDSLQGHPCAGQLRREPTRCRRGIGDGSRWQGQGRLPDPKTKGSQTVSHSPNHPTFVSVVDVQGPTRTSRRARLPAVSSWR